MTERPPESSSIRAISSRDWSRAEEIYLRNVTVNYSDRKGLMRGLADAMLEEYQAIMSAGVILQVDDACVPAQWDRRPELDLGEYRRYEWEDIEVLNHLR